MTDNAELLRVIKALEHSIANPCDIPPLPRKWSREWYALAWARWQVGHSFLDCWISA